MENQDQYIPEHLRERWLRATERLGEAALALNVANEAYQQAIRDRIALSEELKKWQMKEYFDIDI